MDVCVGIDVAKATLSVALVGSRTIRRITVANTAAGHQELLRWLHKQHLTVVRVCLEATGSYGDDVAQTLYDADFCVCVVNPARIAAYAKSHLSRNKTDAADAVLIAQFAHSEQPAVWVPFAPHLRDLRSLVRHLDVLQAQRQAEVNRLELAGQPAVITDVLNKHITFLNEQIAALRVQIRDHIDQHPELKQEHELLDSIVGIGAHTATCILAETGGLSRYQTGNALAAYAGLTPRQYTSGTSVNRRSQLSKIGNAALRKALYMPAIVARKHNPLLKAFADRLQERGLAPKAVIGAVMRKLLVVAYGVVKSGKAFDPSYGEAVAAQAS